MSLDIIRGGYAPLPSKEEWDRLEKERITNLYQERVDYHSKMYKRWDTVADWAHFSMLPIIIFLVVLVVIHSWWALPLVLLGVGIFVFEWTVEPTSKSFHHLEERQKAARELEKVETGNEP